MFNLVSRLVTKVIFNDQQGQVFLSTRFYRVNHILFETKLPVTAHLQIASEMQDHVKQCLTALKGKKLNGVIKERLIEFAKEIEKDAKEILKLAKEMETNE